MNSNWSYSPETPSLYQNRRFFEPCVIEIWQMTLRKNRAPLLSIIELYASFHHHEWTQSGVTVRKRLSWVMKSVTLTVDLWPRSSAWTSPLPFAITPENSVMMRWEKNSGKGVTNRQTYGRTDGRRTGGQTDRQTDRHTKRQTNRGVLRAAWSQLKIHPWFCGSRNGNIICDVKMIPV